MGGYITVARRQKDGTVQSYRSWTNSVPEWVRDTKMITDPDAHLDEWFQYLAETSTQDNTYFQDYQGKVYPTEYGIVFIDQVTNQIFGCQDYTSLGNGLVSDIMHGCSTFSEEVAKFAALGRLKGIEMLRGALRTGEEVFGPKLTAGEIFAWGRHIRDLPFQEKSQYLGALILFDYEPEWKIHNFPVYYTGGTSRVRDPSGMRNLRDNLTDLGIEVNGPKWDEYMTNRYEEG